jgi:hypothetical protein
MTAKADFTARLSRMSLSPPPMHPQSQLPIEVLTLVIQDLKDTCTNTFGWLRFMPLARVMRVNRVCNVRVFPDVCLQETALILSVDYCQTYSIPAIDIHTWR